MQQAFGLNEYLIDMIYKYLFNPILMYARLKQRRIQRYYRDKRLTIGMYSSLPSSSVGFDCNIGSHCNIFNSKLDDRVFLGNNIVLIRTDIGSFSYTGNEVRISGAKIGKFCSISSKVTIGLGKHPTHFVSTNPIFYSNNKSFDCFADDMYFVEDGEPTIIGNDVWIGYNTIIMNDIQIGDGAIIAAGAVVTNNVPAYSIVGGIPAKIIKYRFEKDIIEKLIQLKWWDADPEYLKINYKLFHNIDLFLQNFDSKDKHSI